MEKQAVLETIDNLLIIQERDNRIAQCQRELNSIPIRQKETETWITQAREALDQSKEALKVKQASIKQLELDIESCRQQIIKFREQQYQIKSNVEFRALNNEIAHVQEKIRGLEDREIVLMEQTEQAQAEVARRKSDVETDEVRIREQLQNLEKRREVLEQDIQQIQKDRSGLVTGVNPAWLSRYNHVMDHKKDMALVSIENNACGQCHMTLPPQVIHDTRKSEAIVTCSFCGRILYWTR
ncbi:MAG: hypothetical protein KKE37_06735 [Verrucomicrobia bacterium]|nr:hypothetical protein [Verrucomicrobiota bacterium]MBU4291415.1 hypothetical protein [Verrucomicrobiota bacterium]MBU4429033.1 hypothetical protein [Verrucomicrobiota bacterium]MCG2680304.1 C4-type zinc ribbon domain-containing protein [Kiritimatiellia bacterium]